jgi:hypothetical protein
MRNPLEDAGYVTTAEVARMLDITPRRVRQHVTAGDLAPAGTVMGRDVFTIEAAEGLLALRAERGYHVPQPVDVAAGEIVDGDGAWPPLVVVAS